MCDRQTERPCPNRKCPNHLWTLVSPDRRRMPLSEWPLTCANDPVPEIAGTRARISPVPTLVEIGAVLGLSRERVNQIEARALGKLKRAARQAGW